MQTLKIGFIGQGFIGKNYADDFESRGYSVIRYSLDKEYISNKELLKKCEIVFIAVPTPTTLAGFDHTLVEDVLSLVADGSTVVIKSTLLPGTTKKLQEKNGHLYILHSPEFLREVTAAYDAKNPKRNIIGLPRKDKTFFSRAERVLEILPKAPYVCICDANEAEIIKYASNNFLTMKVVYMNILYDVAQKVGADWSIIKESLLADERIGKSHMDPIHDGGRGAGGHCFIKDFAAFRFFVEDIMEEDVFSIKVLHALEQKNNELLRKSLKSESLLNEVYGV